MTNIHCQESPAASALLHVDPSHQCSAKEAERLTKPPPPSYWHPITITTPPPASAGSAPSNSLTRYPRNVTASPQPDSLNLVALASISHEGFSALCTTTCFTDFTASSSTGHASASSLAAPARGGPLNGVLRSISFHRGNRATIPRTLSSDNSEEVRAAAATGTHPHATTREAAPPPAPLAPPPTAAAVPGAGAGIFRDAAAAPRPYALPPAGGGVAAAAGEWARVSRAVRLAPRRSRSQAVLPVSGSGSREGSSSNGEPRLMPVWLQRRCVPAAAATAGDGGWSRYCGGAAAAATGWSYIYPNFCAATAAAAPALQGGFDGPAAVAAAGAGRGSNADAAAGAGAAATATDASATAVGFTAAVAGAGGALRVATPPAACASTSASAVAGARGRGCGRISEQQQQQQEEDVAATAMTGLVPGPEVGVRLGLGVGVLRLREARGAVVVQPGDMRRRAISCGGALLCGSLHGSFEHSEGGDSDGSGGRDVGGGEGEGLEAGNEWLSALSPVCSAQLPVGWL